MKTIGIIGGGASGLVAAIAAARHQNVRVFILEHKDRLGRKILSTGNGRCNLTNEKMDISCFRSEELPAVQTVLEEFGYEDTLRFFEGLGLLTKSRNGYVYPGCDQAATVLELLLGEIRRLGVTVHTGIHVTKVVPGRKGFRILTDKDFFHADRVIIAAGGKAAKVLGSDGSGYTLAKALGHSLVPVVPALVQLKVKDHPFAKASGVRADAKVSAYADGKLLAEDTGELQITAYGISGIPVFQISRHIAKALYEGKCAKVSVDLLPFMEEKVFCNFLENRRRGRETQEAYDFLTGIFHSKLIPVLLKLAGIPMHVKMKDLPVDAMDKLAGYCKHTLLRISDTNGFDNAQVCAGGVSLREIDSRTMQSRYIEGLYITGELLDADGICGGYNLQWAWATGYLAGEHATK